MFQIGRVHLVPKIGSDTKQQINEYLRDERRKLRLTLIGSAGTIIVIVSLMAGGTNWLLKTHTNTLVQAAINDTKSESLRRINELTKEFEKQRTEMNSILGSSNQSLGYLRATKEAAEKSRDDIASSAELLKRETARVSIDIAESTKILQRARDSAPEYLTAVEKFETQQNALRDALILDDGFLAQVRSEILKSYIPVGTIVAWTGRVDEDLPGGWELCDGLNGRPKLDDDRFLMGVRTSGEVARGGNNAIAMDDGHNHGGKTSRQNSTRLANLNSGTQSEFPDIHDHLIGIDGAHDHGGENRPKFYGVTWIIKVS